MTATEIRAAIDAGKTVHWANDSYSVIKSGYEYLIVRGKDCISLSGTGKYEDVLNGAEDQFYIEGERV